MKTMNLDMIRVSDAKQYEKLQDVGAMLNMKRNFIMGCECVVQNKSNLYIMHPNMQNTSILVFGANTDDYYFGVMVDTYMTCNNGQVVNFPKLLAEMPFCLKMSQNSKGGVGNRGFLINNVDEKDFGKKQLRIEEAIIAIKKYGTIAPLRLEDMPERNNEIHHSGYPFDCRISNLVWLTTEAHKELHRKVGHKSHLRIVEAVSGRPIPDFV